MSANDPRPSGESFAARTYQRYARPLHRYLLRRLQNSQDARDLFQEVWARLCRVQDPSEVKDPQAYIYRVAAHVLSEFLSKRGRNPVTFDSDASEYAAENPPDLASDELMERVNAQKALQRVLAELPYAYREIVYLHLHDGLSFGEIGKRLGFTTSTTREYFFRALRVARTFKAEPHG